MIAWIRDVIWNSNIAGSWDDPANWIDAITGETASAAPGALDSATNAVAAVGVTDVIKGVGDPASLTIGVPQRFRASSPPERSFFKITPPRLPAFLPAAR